MRQALIRSCVYAWFVPVLFFFILHPFTANAQGDPSGSTDHSRAGIEKLLQDLEDPQRLESLKQDLRILLRADEESSEETGAESISFAGRLLRTMSGYIQEVNHVLTDAGQRMLQIPDLARNIAGQAQDPEILGRWVEMGGKVMLALLAGFLAQLLVARLLSRIRNSLKDQETYSKGVRALLMLGKTLLELIPIAAFAAAAYGLLPLVQPRPVTQLVALTLINANVLVRVILAFTRLLLMPGIPSLRLFPLDSESVQYLYIWVRRVVRISVYGYLFLEAALILGLAASLHLFLLKMLGLIISLMVIILVLQNRTDVARWLRGGHKQTEAPGSQTESETADPHLRKVLPENYLRRRFADFWHIAAILLILGVFGTWPWKSKAGATLWPEH
jgi:moderate conductance mechanosensitive channel